MLVATLSTLLSLFALAKASPNSNDLSCPEDWERLDSKCYLIVNEATTWALSRKKCQEQGGKLVLPSNLVESLGIYNLYIQRATSTRDYWIDAIALDEKFPLEYTSTNGQKLNFTNWLDGEPNDPNSCGLVSKAVPRKWFSTNNCDAMIDYICERSLIPKDGGACTFEDDVLFVENSIAKESIEACQEFCQQIINCKFFTWNEESKACGIRKFTPSNYITVSGQTTASKTGKFLDNTILVGNAFTTDNKNSCLKVCEVDDQCLSCTYNDETSDNPNICVLNYGPTERKLSLGPNSGISSASKNC